MMDFLRLESPAAKLLRPLFGRHQGDPCKDLCRRRLLGNEPKFQVFDDPVHGPELYDEGDDLHHLAG